MPLSFLKEEWVFHAEDREEGRKTGDSCPHRIAENSSEALLSLENWDKQLA
jgi:hypothetical protein